MTPNKKRPAKQTSAPSSTTSTTSTSSPDTSTTSSSASSSSAAVGDVVSYQLDEGGPTVTGIVVGKIDGAAERDAALQVAPLPDSTVVPLDAVKG